MHGFWSRIAGSYDRRWQVVLVWAHVCLGRCWLPVLILAAQFGILAYVPQAKEILFALFEPLVSFRLPLFGGLETAIPAVSFFFVSVALSTTLWYSARLLSTIDRHKTSQPNTASRRELRAYHRAIVWVPRWIGTNSLIVMAASALTAGLFPGSQSMLLPLACGVWPLAIVILAQAWIRAAAPSCAWLLLSLPIGIALTGYLWFIRALITNWQTIVVIVILCFTPAIFHVGVIYRRALLRRLSKRSRRMHPAAPRELHHVHWRLLAIALSTSGVLFLVALSPQMQWLSSPDVVLLFLMACASVGTLVTLWFGRLTRWTPSIGWVSVSVTFTAMALALSDASLVSERLDTPIGGASPTTAERYLTRYADQNVILNAHGGGLRAAYFTASVLARVDELSCGNFGRRLATVSAVSGGSLGIATYLMIREHRMRHDAWKNCTPSVLNSINESQYLIDKVLLNDFLSPVLANLLSVDIFSGKAHRGQALLDAWQHALTDAIGENGTTFSSPMSALGATITTNGESHPGTLVIFNSTIVSTGGRVEFSGGANSICGRLTSIGEAVLHSARFPIISPPGLCETTNGPIQLVDGGFYENSGAQALAGHGPIEPGTIWLNIDGNPPAEECALQEGAQEHPTRWSSAAALLATRRGHTKEAEDRLEKLLEHADGARPVKLTFSLEQAFARTIVDRKQRCTFIRTLRAAPLGWYITHSTAEAMNISIISAAAKVCRSLSSLCGEPPR